MNPLVNLDGPRAHSSAAGSPKGLRPCLPWGHTLGMSSEAPCVAAKPGNSPNVMARCGLSVTSSWLAAPHFLQDGRRPGEPQATHREASWWGGPCRMLPPEGLWSGPCPAPPLISPCELSPRPGSCPQMWQLQVPPRGPTRQDHQDWEDQDQDQDQGWEDSAPQPIEDPGSCSPPVRRPHSQLWGPSHTWASASPEPFPSPRCP